MTWVHVWYCGRWIWRVVTLKQFAAMPHIGRQLALLKVAKMGGVGLCAVAIGFGVPPVINGGWVPSLAPIGSRATPVRTPEPGTFALLGLGLVGLAIVRRRAPK